MSTQFPAPAKSPAKIDGHCSDDFTLERMVHLLAVVAGCISILTACSADTCGNQVQQTVTSPSGKLAAIAFSRDCGATTGFSTQVSVLPAGRSLPNEPGNTYVVGGKTPLTLEWQGDATLRIRGTGEQVFKQEIQVSGVTVKYGNAL